MDLAKLSLGELVSLNKQVKTAIETRRPNESKVARKEWLASEDANAFRLRIESLRKEYDKISARCNKQKSVVLRVKLDVDIVPAKFDDLLRTTWEREFYDIFETDCSGELLNPDACPELAKEIQNQIDSLMEEICGDVVKIHGSLHDDCEDFVDSLNELLMNIRDAQELDINAADLIKSPMKGKK